MTPCTAVFQHYLASKTQAQQDNLKLYEQDILNQALANIGLEAKKELPLKDARRLLVELEGIVHLSGQLPCLIGAGNQDRLIDPTHLVDASMSVDEINAHNILLHLARGVALSDEEQLHYERSFLAHPDIIKHFLSQRNPHLMRALRQQIQLVFDNAWEQLRHNALSEDSIGQYEVFQSNLLALYPFWDPEEADEIALPQKINGQWQRITYQFRRFDISPKSGPLSWVIEDEDRMYSFALEPKEGHLAAPSHLLLMGTIYPSGQGHALAGIYNFCPGHSVGEKHDMSEVHAWLNQQERKNVRVTGHSKGATMAMTIAAEHPDKIIQSDCLNPAMLSHPTFKRLAPAWDALSCDERPLINIYAQKGDPIFLVDKHFLNGSRIYRIIPNTDKPAINVRGSLSLPIPEIIRKSSEAHAHFFSGRERALFLNVNVLHERKLKTRALLRDMKSVFDCFYFPIEYSRLFLSIIDRKINRFYTAYEPLFIAALIGSTLVAGTVFF